MGKKKVSRASTKKNSKKNLKNENIETESSANSNNSTSHFFIKHVPKHRLYLNLSKEINQRSHMNNRELLGFMSSSKKIKKIAYNWQSQNLYMRIQQTKKCLSYQDRGFKIRKFKEYKDNKPIANPDRKPIKRSQTTSLSNIYNQPPKFNLVITSFNKDSCINALPIIISQWSHATSLTITPYRKYEDYLQKETYDQFLTPRSCNALARYLHRFTQLEELILDFEVDESLLITEDETVDILWEFRQLIEAIRSLKTLKYFDLTFLYMGSLEHGSVLLNQLVFNNYALRGLNIYLYNEFKEEDFLNPIFNNFLNLGALQKIRIKSEMVYLSNYLGLFQKYKNKLKNLEELVIDIKNFSRARCQYCHLKDEGNIKKVVEIMANFPYVKKLRIGFRGFGSPERTQKYMKELVKFRNLKIWHFVEDGFKFQDPENLQTFISYLTSLSGLEEFMFMGHEQMKFDIFKSIYGGITEIKSLRYLTLYFPQLIQSGKEALDSQTIKKELKKTLPSLTNLVNLGKFRLYLSQESEEYNICIPEICALLPLLPNLTSFLLPETARNISTDIMLELIELCSKKLHLREFEFRTQKVITKKSEKNIEKLVRAFFGFQFIKDIRLAFEKLLPAEENEKIIKHLLSRPNIEYLEYLTNNLSDNRKAQINKLSRSECVLKLSAF